MMIPYYSVIPSLIGSVIPRLMYFCDRSAGVSLALSMVSPPPRGSPGMYLVLPSTPKTAMVDRCSFDGSILKSRFDFVGRGLIGCQIPIRKKKEKRQAGTRSRRKKKSWRMQVARRIRLRLALMHEEVPIVPPQIQQTQYREPCFACCYHRPPAATSANSNQLSQGLNTRDGTVRPSFTWGGGVWV